MKDDQHFTRLDVADLLCALTLGGSESRVLDPACGDGVLLASASARLKQSRTRNPVLRGVEVDPALAGKARVHVPGAEVTAADFFSLAPRGQYDAIVGNPPYVRQELIGARRKDDLAANGPFRFSRRSDLHVYFWPLCMELLRPGGTLGFLTSSTWLDASYGRPLRRWLVENFNVVAVIESHAESWFDKARVRTAITIVRNEPPAGRARFVRLTERLDSLVPPDLKEEERLDRFERLARRMLKSRAETRSVAIRRTPVPPDGGRWSAPLRQPDLYFELLERAKGRLVPLGSVATIRWGIKTGDDSVFYLGRNEPTRIEKRFLKPVVFNLMELDRVVIIEAHLKRRLLLVDHRWQKTTDTHLSGYIETAEREWRTHERPTCAARQRAGRAWYELRPGRPGAILWSIMHQYRHLVPLNPAGFPTNDNLLLIDPVEGIDSRLLAAILNSHVQALIKYAYGRQRNEGMLKTQAFDVREMLVPDPRMISKVSARRITGAFEPLLQRRIGTITEETAAIDRGRLDREVLGLLGYRHDEADEIADRLSESLVSLCMRERRCELDAVSRRRVKPAPAHATRAALQTT